LGGCDEDARDAVITDGAMAKAAGVELTNGEEPGVKLRKER